VVFGAERRFYFKHKRKPLAISIVLEHGSLLVMKDVSQTKMASQPAEGKEGQNLANQSHLLHDCLR